MISLKDAEGVSNGGRIEGPDFHPGLPKRSPEAATGSPGTHPVIQDPHLDAFFCLLHQGVSEYPSHPVIPENVILEMDVVPGPIDGFDPRVEGIGAVEL
jgi:hypothetical protein